MRQATELSLIELCDSNSNLPGVTEISYPADGTTKFSSFEKTHFWFEHRRQVVLELLRKHFSEKSNVIGADIGCGSGYTAEWLTQREFATIGIDGHGKFESAKQRRLARGFIAGDLMQINPAAEFDFVLLMDVIEHLEDDKAFFEKACAMLRPGGILIVTFPAYQWLWSTMDDYAEHKRRYVLSDLTRLTESSEKSVNLIRASYLFMLTFPLFLISRILTRHKPVDKTLETEGKISPTTNWLMLKLLSCERTLLSHQRLPFGSSCLGVFQKG